MTRLLEIVRTLTSGAGAQHARDEAYLAESVDIYDLERRMREIDQRARNPSPYPSVAPWLW